MISASPPVTSRMSMPASARSRARRRSKSLAALRGTAPVRRTRTGPSKRLKARIARPLSMKKLSSRKSCAMPALPRRVGAARCRPKSCMAAGMATPSPTTPLPWPLDTSASGTGRQALSSRSEKKAAARMVQPLVRKRVRTSGRQEGRVICGGSRILVWRSRTRQPGRSVRIGAASCQSWGIRRLRVILSLDRPDSPTPASAPILSRNIAKN